MNVEKAMKSNLKLILMIGTPALTVSSATALAAGRPADVPPQGRETGQAHAPDNLAPGRACRAMSRRHVKGERVTDFRRCVKAAAKLRRHQHNDGEAPA